MYRLSHDVDLSFLVGVELLQVCVGKNEVILNFDRNVRLTILSDFAVAQRGEVSTTYQEPTIGAVALLGLLHDAVSAARATPQGGMVLTFSSGGVLEVHDTSDQYESFWIANGSHQIIV